MINKEGETILPFYKGLLCWFCISLWFLFWGGMITFLTDVVELPEVWAATICTIGGGLFGLVPVVFFVHERKKDICHNHTRV